MTKERQGEIFVLIGAFFWGFFPIVTILSLNSLYPLSSLAWSTVLTTILFAGILTVKKSWKELKNRSALIDILLATIFNSFLYYVFFFIGLKYTSAGNASIIALTEVLFSFLFFHIWRKDYISKEHIGGAVLMFAGAIIVLYPNLTGFKMGDILILCAAFVAPFGNFLQQKARRKVSSETILFVRNLAAVPLIFLTAFFLNQISPFSDLKHSIILILLNGLILLGLAKILWIESIHRISVTKAVALSSFNPLITVFFAWIILSDTPTFFQLFSLAPMILGVILLGINKKQEKVEFQTTP